MSSAIKKRLIIVIVVIVVLALAIMGVSGVFSGGSADDDQAATEVQGDGLVLEDTATVEVDIPEEETTTPAAAEE
jgi:flagellar basal body-associated protein FliL